jgi:CheY-specific phosphatase CheX
MSVIAVEYINPFFAATRQICGETLKIPVSTGKPRLCLVDERVWKLYQVSAVIHLNSAVEGVISLSFSEHVALALASALADTFFESLNADARDALGEVANLVVGTAKRNLPTELVTISPPQIVQTFEVQFPHGLPIIILPFEAAPGRFLMQLAMKQNQMLKKAG